MITSKDISAMADSQLVGEVSHTKATLVSLENEVTKRKMIAQFNRSIHNIVLIEVAKTWERTRIGLPYGEFVGVDNIMSQEEIEQIAHQIYQGEVVQEYLKTRDPGVWGETKEGMSDWYIQAEAEAIIKKYYL